MLVRFTAAGLIGCSILIIGLYWVDALMHHQPVSAPHLALLSIPFVLGVIGLFTAKCIAAWVSDKLDW